MIWRLSFCAVSTLRRITMSETNKKPFQMLAPELVEAYEEAVTATISAHAMTRSGKNLEYLKECLQWEEAVKKELLQRLLDGAIVR